MANDTIVSPSPELKDYKFPTSSLTTKLSENDKGKTPIVLCACGRIHDIAKSDVDPIANIHSFLGSFSPITYLHLRMFEMAKDWAKTKGDCTVVGSYLSPVGDAYRKKDLAPASDRLKMCNLATSDHNAGVMVDPWEAVQTKYCPTRKVLDHFDHEINKVLGKIDDGTGNKRDVQIMFLGGADLLESFTIPGVWAQEDLDYIMKKYGVLIVERHGTNLDDVLPLLTKWEKHIHIISQWIDNDVSSTKIRTLIKKELSIRYLIPQTVVDYISEKNLYPPEASQMAQSAIINGKTPHSFT